MEERSWNFRANVSMFDPSACAFLNLHEEDLVEITSHFVMDLLMNAEATIARDLEKTCEEVRTSGWEGEANGEGCERTSI